ncbi:MAG: M16 family metallopeptidase, partial [Saprospiraceae bacterium]
MRKTISIKSITYQALSAVILTVFIACAPKTAPTGGVTPPGAQGSAPAIPIPQGPDFRKTAPQPGAAPKIQIGKAETFKLENGLTVILVQNSKLPVVSFRVFSDYQPVLQKQAAGYVDMMGELLSKGTRNRSKSQIDEETDFIGATLSSDANGVSGRCLSKHSDKLLELMSDVLLNPTFPEEELEKAKKRAESGLASAKDNANTISANVGAVLRNRKEHPYGELMTEETLAKINREMILNHYQTFLRPNISYLVITGDMNRAQAEKAARKHFGKWPVKPVTQAQFPTPQPPEKTQVSFVQKPGAVQSVINITYPLDLTPGHPDAIPVRVMNTILGGYFNSRVNIKLREDKGWTYGARTAVAPDPLVANFSAGASVRNMVTDSAVAEFLYEIQRLRTEKAPADELNVVKSVLTGQFSQSLEQPGTVASFALNTARFNLPADYYERYLESLQSVTSDDVLNMARKYLLPERAHILVVGNREEVAEKLQKFDAEGKINFYDVYGNPSRFSNAKVEDGVSAESIIERYVNAIGGAEKIAQINDVYIEGKINLGGGIFVKTWQKANTKIAVESSMMGQILSKQAFDGQKGFVEAQGQGVSELDEEQIADMKEQALFCKEAAYAALGYKLTLKGLEDLDGKNAYVVEVTRPNGRQSVEYYDKDTGLKLREISARGEDEEQTIITNDYSDYREVAGLVRKPYVITTSGAMPMPL